MLAFHAPESFDGIADCIWNAYTALKTLHVARLNVQSIVIQFWNRSTNLIFIKRDLSFKVYRILNLMQN